MARVSALGGTNGGLSGIIAELKTDLKVLNYLSSALEKFRKYIFHGGCSQRPGRVCVPVFRALLG